SIRVNWLDSRAKLVVDGTFRADSHNTPQHRDVRNRQLQAYQPPGAPAGHVGGRQPQDANQRGNVRRQRGTSQAVGSARVIGATVASSLDVDDVVTLREVWPQGGPA